MGVTTKTASVTPADRPARKQGLALAHLDCPSIPTGPCATRRTEERGSPGNLPRFLVCQQLLVPVVGRKPNGHFRYDARHDRAKAFVQCQWSFSPYYIFACGQETSPLCL